MEMIRLLSPPRTVSNYKPNVLDMSSSTKINARMSLSNFDESLNSVAKSVDLGKIGGAFSKLGNVSVSGFQKRISEMDVIVPPGPIKTGTGNFHGNILDKIF